MKAVVGVCTGGAIGAVDGVTVSHSARRLVRGAALGSAIGLAGGLIGLIIGVVLCANRHDTDCSHGYTENGNPTGSFSRTGGPL